MTNTLNDRAWDKFFAESDALAEIAARGFAYVSAEELKEKGRREPRLMAKLDTLAERPQIFDEYGINILPAQNGEYILFLDPDNKSYFAFQSTLEEAPLEQFTSHI
ncbi:MAG: hypothetical protein KGS72_25280, partial [Cyanobacteria bacterium REEB67]|nr:hypothetical protein [Cyanobacteria bacterium REEB67]